MPTTEVDAATSTTLETARLMLRRPCQDDARRIAALANDRDVAEKTARMPYPYGLADAEAWLAHLLEPAKDITELAFAIERRADQVFLGIVSLVRRGDETSAEIGFWLGKPFWNCGYMTEAVTRMMRFSFEDLDLSVVRGGAFPDNTASIRVQEKVGMVQTGREMQPAPARGGDKEVVVLMMTREAWQR